MKTLWFGAALALALSASAPSMALAQGAPTPQAVKAATDAFTAGSALFKQKKFPAALQKFQDSYNAVQSPNSALFIARSEAELGHPKEAYNWFQRVIAEASARMVAEPKYKPTYESAQMEIADVANKIALITVNVRDAQPTTTVRVAGAPVARDQWGKPLPLDPVPTDILLETPGQQPFSQRLELKAGDKKSVDLAHPAAAVIAPPPPVTKPSSGGPGLLPVAIAFGGVGVLGMGLFGVAGGLTLAAESELVDKCGENGPCTSAADDELVDSAQTKQTLANVGLIVGAVGLAAGVTFLVIDIAGSGSSDGSAQTEFVVGPGFAGLQGRF